MPCPYGRRHERFFGADPVRIHMLLHQGYDKQEAMDRVRRFLEREGSTRLDPTHVPLELDGQKGIVFGTLITDILAKTPRNPGEIRKD